MAGSQLEPERLSLEVVDVAHLARQVCSSVSKVNEDVPIDFISDIGLQGPPCYYSSLHDGGLENIAKYYPDATIMLVTRNASSWYRSMSKWGSIMHRWKKFCGFDGYHASNDKYWTKLKRWFRIVCCFLVYLLY